MFIENIVRGFIYRRTKEMAHLQLRTAGSLACFSLFWDDHQLKPGCLCLLSVCSLGGYSWKTGSGSSWWATVCNFSPEEKTSYIKPQAWSPLTSPTGQFDIPSVPGGVGRCSKIMGCVSRNFVQLWSVLWESCVCLQDNVLVSFDVSLISKWGNQWRGKTCPS